MTESKHTPGPWKSGNTLHENADSTWDVYAPSSNPARFNGDRIAECSSEADARIMATAPELLSVLKTVEQLFAYEIEGYPITAASVSAAIAKAEGR